LEEYFEVYMLVTWNHRKVVKACATALFMFLDNMLL